LLPRYFFNPVVRLPPPPPHRFPFLCSPLPQWKWRWWALSPFVPSQPAPDFSPPTFYCLCGLFSQASSWLVGIFVYPPFSGPSNPFCRCVKLPSIHTFSPAEEYVQLTGYPLVRLFPDTPFLFTRFLVLGNSIRLPVLFPYSWASSCSFLLEVHQERWNIFSGCFAADAP